MDNATRLSPPPPKHQGGPWATLIKERRKTGRYPKGGTLTSDGWNRQVDFANYLDVPQTTLSSWETGNTVPSYDQQRRLIRLLDVSPEELWRRLYGMDAA